MKSIFVTGSGQCGETFLNSLFKGNNKISARDESRPLLHSYYKFIKYKYRFFIGYILISIFVFSGIQLLVLGFIGEYVMSILIQMRKMPLVIEKERINF